MLKNLLFIHFSILLTACSHTYYVVRHAEKVVNTGATMMAGDPPLTDAGQRRAEALKEALGNKNIRYVFSTNTLRARSTALPLCSLLGITVETYQPRLDSAFIHKLKGIKKNVLIVGHSKTVDDIVNSLCNAIKVPGDLNDNQYDDLFEVKYKRFFGKRIRFERKKYGESLQ